MKGTKENNQGMQTKGRHYCEGKKELSELSDFSPATECIPNMCATFWSHLHENSLSQLSVVVFGTLCFVYASTLNLWKFCVGVEHVPI